ncbi:YidC/Oxa1 family membrane protein insertase [Patescibacteria group bacterium]|nr:YidC/Oxa1 family membrane protein insertase [Patescibacteria group bacterium]MBU1123488.1 YidC/Oxa1 family membrane protein insertase [Patescibacteria group bacterium]
MAKSKFRDFIEFFILFLALYLLVQFALNRFFPSKFGDETQQKGVVLSMQDATLKSDHHPIAYIKNNTEEALVLEDRCPQPPFKVSKLGDGGYEELIAEEIATPCESFGEVAAGQRMKIDLGPWKYSLFSDISSYRIELIGAVDEAGESIKADFIYHESGPVTKAFRAFISKPLLNLLILITSFMPDYNLGMAIIILTIIVKLILFIPTQQGLQGQKRMQAVQPKIDALKSRYKGDPQRMQQETMKIWKEHNVNPFQSCLPILIQFPILIGLFFVIRDGSVLELSRHLIYEPYIDLSWSFGTHFLGLNLTEPSKLLMPPLLVALQFSQMKLSFAIAKKKKDNNTGAGLRPAGKKEKSPQEMQQKMMLYGLPLMIGVFALQFPAAVSLYWAVSTVFAIGQQVVVNRRELR